VDELILTGTVDIAVAARAEQVKNKLVSIRRQVEDHFFDMCDLLREAQDNAYHLVYGYTRFGDWVDATPELDLSARQAYYYINIAKKVDELGITREQIRAVNGISKLKEIFSLEPTDFADQIVTLIEGAASDSLEQVKEKVRQVRADSGKPAPCHMTLKFDEHIKDTVDRALELARLNIGDSVVNGEIVEPSTSLCIEMICASYLQDPNNYPEGVSQSDL
jgi:hypothetical protein